VLCRSDDGAVALLDGWCTHGHAHLGDGVLRGTTIECPKHNGRFELATGAPCRRPVREPIAVHAVEIVGRRIVGHVPTPPPSIVAPDPSE
jgi:nitrite reductase/ring-hydroxylating ferredoxin subunit